MDKATLALATAEDNAAAIRKIAKALNGGAKIDCRISDNSCFGTVASCGDTVVIIFADYNYEAMLYFGDEELANGSLPLIAALPAREDVLRLDREFPSGVLILGGISVVADVFE